MRNKLVIISIIAVFLFNSCSAAKEVLAPEKDLINTVAELEERVEEALKNGEKEISFVTDELNQEDLKNLNQNHDGFYGNVTQYEIKTVKLLNRSYMTLQCDISDNYYVEEAILNNSEIPSERPKAEELKKVCEDVLKKVEKAGSDYKKEKKIHDYLVKNVAYGYPEGKDSKDSNAYNAYGALVQGKAVCNGYAQAMKLLCDLSGIDCRMISGQADGENHAWNLISLDEEWYHVDVTWDDPEPDNPKRLLYSYFNLDDEEMSDSHTWEQTNYTAASGTKYQYYRKNDLYCKDIDAFKDKCEEIFEEGTPKNVQVQVGDYAESRYTEENLQFIFEYSGAQYINLQTIGNAPYTVLYFVLDY